MPEKKRRAIEKRPCRQVKWLGPAAIPSRGQVSFAVRFGPDINSTDKAKSEFSGLTV